MFDTSKFFQKFLAHKTETIHTQTLNISLSETVNQ